ncbi:MAG: hypothetical protein WC501_01855 [Candidatus Micrarchaeia archaeon]
MTPKQMGRAYAFFDCKKSIKQIGRSISKIRRFAQIPPMVELKLVEGPKNLKTRDRQLKEIRDVATEENIRYAMKAMFPGRDNLSAVHELVTFMTQAYYSVLYQEGEPFRGKIIYKVDGKYVEWGKEKDN